MMVLHSDLLKELHDMHQMGLGTWRARGECTQKTKIPVYSYTSLVLENIKKKKWNSKT